MRQLLNSHEFKCSEEMLTIAAMTQVQVSTATYAAGDSDDV